MDGKGALSIFEAATERALTQGPLNCADGIFSAALSRREPITISGKRAGHHSLIYAEPQIVGAIAAIPLFEESQARGILLVDREQEQAFTESELRTLVHSGDFVLRSVQNERVYAQLDRANREQSKLYRAVESLSSAVTEAQVIEVGVESAREVASFDFAAVTLFHKKGGTHEICAVSGHGADNLVGRTFRHNAGLVSMVVANRQALPYRGEYDPSRQTVFARGHEPPKMPSLLVLPLLVHERVLGTLVLGSSEKHAFRENVRPALEVLSSHMAVSLSGARMLTRLEEQATTDGMTGLLNKRTLIIEAERRIKVAKRFGKPLSLLVCDIDHFKNVNDTYGHDVGDVVIKGLGDVLRRIKRDTDAVGRFGGEEFVILCEQTDEEGALNLGERVRRELEATTFQSELGPLQVTCSVGVAPFPIAGQEWATLFKATDEALYVSKREGRNRVTVWRPNLRTSAA
jgi:diguanylate cyclase (GGDEF)-like protein